MKLSIKFERPQMLFSGRIGWVSDIPVRPKSHGVYCNMI